MDTDAKQYNPLLHWLMQTCLNNVPHQLPLSKQHDYEYTLCTYLSFEYFSGDHVVTDTSIRNLVRAQLPEEDPVGIDVTGFVHTPIGQDL